MKKSLYGVVFFTSIILAACAQSRNTQETYYDEFSNANAISYQQFYDELSPYGQWLNDPEYGYVWRPGEAGFRPYYTNGNWEYTNYGWTWVSAYNWGWAPFHYGRWYYDNFNGWMWVPGYDWAPAWVSWRGNSQYYGWAPLCPQQRNGRNYQIQNDQWLFVPKQYITSRDVNNYYVNQQNNYTIINNTTVINKSRVRKTLNQYPQGPDVTEVEKVTGTTIRPLKITRSTAPGSPQLQNGALQIYKPAVNTKVSTGSRPGKFENMRNVSGRDLQPVNQSPAVVNQKSAAPGNRIIRQPLGGDINKNTTPAPGNVTRPVVQTPVTPDPSPTTNNKPLNSPAQQIRNLPAEQNQPHIVRPMPGEMRAPNTNSQVRQLPQVKSPAQDNPLSNQTDNRLNNNQPVRTPVAPGRSLPANETRERRVQNNQQQNPAFNQRPAREQQAPAFERPSPNSLEKRAQPIPANQTSPQQARPAGKR